MSQQPLRTCQMRSNPSRGIYNLIVAPLQHVADHIEQEGSECQSNVEASLNNSVL